MHFQSRKRSVKGMTGFWLSLAGAVVLLALIAYSLYLGGAAGTLAGFIGLFDVVLCGVAFSLSLAGLREQDVFTKLPFTGLIISAVLLLCMFCMYISGIVWKG